MRGTEGLSTPPLGSYALDCVVLCTRTPQLLQYVLIEVDSGNDGTLDYTMWMVF